MKKTLLLALVLLTAVVAQAQSLAVSPQLSKGMKKVYHQETTSTLPTQGEAKTTATIEVSVADVTADGYVLNYTMSDVKTTAEGLAGRLAGMSMEMFSGVGMQLKTDKAGRVSGIRNYDAVKQQAAAVTEKMYDALAAESPEVSQVLSKEQFINQIASSLTEETMVKTLTTNTGILTLNGKTVTTGMQDEYTTDQGLKLKRMYIVNGKQVIASATLNMTEADIKQMIIAQVEKMMPDQAEMIKQNIDMVISSGAMKIDGSEKATYTFGADGWASRVESEFVSSLAGQATKVVNVITLQ